MKRLTTALLLAIVFNCSNKETTPEPELTTSETLTLYPNGWVVKSIFSWQENRMVDVVEESNRQPRCAFDDAFIFHKDGFYEVVTESACVSNGTEFGQWKLIGDGSVISFTPDLSLTLHEPYTWTLKSVSRKELSLRSALHIGFDHSIYVPK